MGSTEVETWVGLAGLTGVLFDTPWGVVAGESGTVKSGLMFNISLRRAFNERAYSIVVAG